MKKTLAVLIAVLMLSTVAFAGPFVRCDVGLAQTPSFAVDLTAGYKAGGFSGSFTANDVFATTHTLAWWGSTTAISLKNIGLINPIESAALGWLGTVHLGALLATDTELAPYTFDLYGGFDVKYNFFTPAWIPTGKIGFYWELK